VIVRLIRLVIVFEVEEKYLDKMVQVVKTAMESVFLDLLVPLTVTM
jgi:DNA polymerase I-like protein with 3'-5' exonuclease and polymerase domains